MRGKFFGLNKRKMSKTALASMLENDFLMLEQSRKGLSKASFLQITEAFPFNLKEWHGLVGLDQPFEQVVFLNELMAERVLLIAQVAKRGKEVFGSFEIFRKWLDSPIPALNNEMPISFLNNSFGFKILQDELGRIEHGIFA
jgi:hypothetical protein